MHGLDNKIRIEDGDCLNTDMLGGAGSTFQVVSDVLACDLPGVETVVQEHHPSFSVTFITTLLLCFLKVICRAVSRRRFTSTSWSPASSDKVRTVQLTQPLSSVV